MSSPSVSVIMAVYNAMPYLQEAVESVLSQTLADIELIIVDDMSTDGSWDYIEKIEDSRVIAVRMPENSGPGLSRNRALGLAKGQYIATMDADDISLPERLAIQKRYLDEHPEVMVVATSLKKEGKEFSALNSVLRPTREHLLFHPSFGMATTMYRKELYSLHHIEYPDIRRGQDWVFFYQATKKGEIHVLKDELCKYRIILIDQSYKKWEKIELAISQMFDVILVDYFGDKLPQYATEAHFALISGKHVPLSMLMKWVLFLLTSSSKGWVVQRLTLQFLALYPARYIKNKLIGRYL